MRFPSLTSALFWIAGIVTAIPLPGESTTLKPRQYSDTSNDLKDDACRAITFIFARGSTESGNMGSIVGPEVCADLQNQLGATEVACQGVGSPYDATLEDNFLPQNTSPTDIGAATTLFELAHTKCPDTIVVAGGYSQGTAVMDGSIQALPAAIQNQIAGVVLFGFTRNVQDNGGIPNFPASKTKVYCALGDLVCDDTLIITPAHLTYGSDASSAASWLKAEIQAAK
ncbi:putative cutinase [Talaromyces proteolyticus]|uniref:Cutinase n=1 Tax=Talaromyces proteolyticus TaxID=1131652 RepID=A0AAD4PYR0_9EURO|nr:putative cutinase [Talaromyces proteolyticus]KAH8697979.1 putative cutinase [Talaromyces proteolyticus]